MQTKSKKLLIIIKYHFLETTNSLETISTLEKHFVANRQTNLVKGFKKYTIACAYSVKDDKIIKNKRSI